MVSLQHSHRTKAQIARLSALDAIVFPFSGSSPHDVDPDRNP
jgi:hypothetical protein